MTKPTILELSDFQIWLCKFREFTTNEAIELCEIGPHEKYLRLFAEWERHCKECEATHDY